MDTSYAVLAALSSGESIVFVQKPLGLFRHQDADLFPLEGERYPEPSQVNVRDGVIPGALIPLEGQAHPRDPHRVVRNLWGHVECVTDLCQDLEGTKARRVVVAVGPGA